MDRLTIVRRPAAEATPLWQFEVLETGETFADLTEDIALAYSSYVQQQRLNEWLCEYEYPPSLPTFDESIPEIQLDITARQEEIETLLIQAYAQVVINIIMDLVDENCEGCKNDYVSQSHHDCFMLDNDIRVYRYLAQALEKVNDDTVMTRFSKLTETLEPCLNGLELLRYDCKDSRAEIVSRKRDDLETLLIDKLNMVHDM